MSDNDNSQTRPIFTEILEIFHGITDMSDGTTLTPINNLIKLPGSNFIVMMSKFITYCAAGIRPTL